jgi:hypothetical protein
MKIEKRLKNHQKRWNISSNQEEDFLQFKCRLSVILDIIIVHYLSVNTEFDVNFKQLYNYANPAILDRSEMISKVHINPSPVFGNTYIFKKISECRNIRQIADFVQILFWALEEESFEPNDLSLRIQREIKRISILTPNASFQIKQKGKQFIVYPSGDQLLDEEIINYTLSGLEDYPEVAKSFENALMIYQSGEVGKYRDLLDNLRLALEQLLKKILRNGKSLENQNKILNDWLKEKRLHSQVVHLYGHLLRSYQQYQNDAVKHNDNNEAMYSIDDVEFMIYLTGNFMRLILKLAIEDASMNKSDGNC